MVLEARSQGPVRGVTRSESDETLPSTIGSPLSKLGLQGLSAGVAESGRSGFRVGSLSFLPLEASFAMTDVERSQKHGAVEFPHGPSMKRNGTKPFPARGKVAQTLLFKCAECGLFEAPPRRANKAHASRPDSSRPTLKDLTAFFARLRR
jgi:hypothetical protein